MNRKSSGPNPEPDAGRAPSARVLADAAECVIVDLEQRLALGVGPLERALAARIREAVGRLCECARQLAKDELMISGSTGRQHPQPLLSEAAVPGAARARVAWCG